MKSKRLKAFLWVAMIAVNVVLAQDKTGLEFSRTEVIPIQDTQNDRAYELYVRLPANYADSVHKQYPVLYYTDAMWHVEMLSGATDFLMEEAILVGISWQLDIDAASIEELGAHVSRYRDYSFREISNEEYQKKYNFGQADKHMAFIEKDVIPYVEHNYRTQPNQRSYFGYSMSGEFGTYLMLAQPGLFNQYILGSPSIREDDIAELTEISAQVKELNAQVFISYGSEEEAAGKRIETFIDMLKSRNDQSLKLNPVVVEGDHQRAFPMTAVRGVEWVSNLYAFPSLSGPYFGQEIPELEPSIFAPGTISVDGRQENGISFSPDLDEVFFSAEKVNGDPAIYFSKLENGKWTVIEEAGFTEGRKSGEMQPFVSFDNEKIYFTGHNSDLSDTKIWYVDRDEDSWGKAQRLALPIEDKAFYANQSANGDLFFTNVSTFKMNQAENENGNYPDVQEMEVDFGFHGFIAPDQGYMVVNYRHQEDPNRKDHDIFVYFKKKDGSWTEPINLGGSVNSDFDENTPSITPDGKFLFFLRRNKDGGTLDVYWVSTEVIERLRPPE
ncbi:MAG: alpha/beta hydrolase-fold protein [Cytophagales bacterium]|nr:alpha/beta hydrolase-fold protein [Cytophagales bacterium]